VVVSGRGDRSTAGAATDSGLSWMAEALADGEGAVTADDEGGTGLRVARAEEADTATATG
jgi:hypothetical protein